MISDNAKTFKSAAATLHTTLQSPEIRKYFSQLYIEWKFNLEKAPWWGGIFERMIRSAKRCLRKAIGKTSLTYDELLTLVTEVEAVLNSRPLTYVSSEDTDEPLTPSHLLVGYRVPSLPNPSIPEDTVYSPETLTRRKQHLVETLTKFWRRWKKEYLLELREFHRNQVKGGMRYRLEKGEVVTVYDEGHPRGLWRLGKIEDVIQSTDGGVRGVVVKVTSRGGSVKYLRRPVQHIYPLEVRCSSSPPEDDGKTPTDDDKQDLDEGSHTRPTRKSVEQARDRIIGCLIKD